MTDRRRQAWQHDGHEEQKAATESKELSHGHKIATGTTRRKFPADRAGVLGGGRGLLRRVYSAGKGLQGWPPLAHRKVLFEKAWLWTWF